MHFWAQRDITDRLIAQRAARRERRADNYNGKLFAALLGATWLSGREYDPGMITQTYIEEWE